MRLSELSEGDTFDFTPVALWMERYCNDETGLTGLTATFDYMLFEGGGIWELSCSLGCFGIPNLTVSISTPSWFLEPHLN